jgi:hypothetical protein
VRHYLIDLQSGVDIILKASEDSYVKSFGDLRSDVESMRLLLEQRVVTR